MSETREDSSKSLICSPPKSLMKLEDANEIWTIITKRYPKAAPLLSEMEAVLDHAENLLEQLKSPCDLGIEESLDVNLSESEKSFSETTNLCKQNIFGIVQSNTSTMLETQDHSFNYMTSTESMFSNKKQKEVSINNGDRKTVSTSCCSTNTTEETNPIFTKLEENTKEFPKKINPDQSEESTQTCIIETGSMIYHTCTTELDKVFKLPEKPKEIIKKVKTAIPVLKSSPRKCANEIEESIPHFKKVIEAIKLNEECCQSIKKIENSDSDKEPQKKLEKLAGIIRTTNSSEIKVTDTASIEAWDKVIGNSAKSNEISRVVTTLKLADETCNVEECPDKLSKKCDDISPKTTTSTIEPNNKKNLNEESPRRYKKKTLDQDCGNISISSLHNSSVLILEQYAKACNKPVDYLSNDDRKGKIEITCSFAKYKVSSCGKLQDHVKNEAAARMLYMLVTSQMEENIVGNLKEFSREQILEILKLDRRDSFMPLSGKRISMVKLYTFCLEENLPEPKYKVTSDKQYGFVSTCKVLEYIGKGTGRTEGNAKEKAAEDLFKKCSQKLKHELMGL